MVNIREYMAQLMDQTKLLAEKVWVRIGLIWFKYHLEQQLTVMAALTSLPPQRQTYTLVISVQIQIQEYLKLKILDSKMKIY